MPISRRQFMGRSGAVAATALAAPHIARSADQPPRPGQKPRHIIMLVADGMSQGTLTCADLLSQITRKRGTEWMKLYNHPAAFTGLMNMRSLDSLVTDSSAASSSWGSGSRIANGAVNVLPDGRELTPLYTLFKQAGWKRGLVTTTEITHATPAGFAANDGKRSSAENIARQYLERRVDVLLGGGKKFYDPKRRKDKADLWKEYRAAGYHVALDKAALAKAPLDKPWLGTFYESHLPLTVDWNQSQDMQRVVPTLAEMTGAALRRLEREEHFILQVEGGRVDHGAHNSDAAGAFFDLISFDEALEVCLEFQKRTPDTLLVITTDHGNGNPGLNGIGKNYMASSPLFANLKEFKSSTELLLKRLGIVPASEAATDTKTDAKTGTKAPAAPKPAPAATDIQNAIADACGYKASIAKCDALARVIEKKGLVMFETMNSTAVQLGQLLANHTGVGWTSGAHTADYVAIASIGPGAEKFGGFIQNTDVFRHFLGFAGIDFKNPELPLMAAASAPDAGVEEPHWLAEEAPA
jgi:alkaline phosphatase